MSETVKRWRLVWTGPEDAEFEEHPGGDYVLYSDYAALKSELDELKESISWEGREPHLAKWRKECFDRDQSCGVLDSDIVALIDRAGAARTELAALKAKADRLAEVLGNVVTYGLLAGDNEAHAKQALADYKGE